MMAALAATLALTLPSEARVKVGIGEQSAGVFSHPRFAELKLRYARINVPWDALSRGTDRAETDAWLAGARAAHVRPLVTFTHSRVKPRKRPSARKFKKTVRAFRKRYPWVRDYSAWNEANHQSQPTFHRPKVAARYYNVLRKNCKRCTIVALDVLDQGGMVSYVKKFKRYAKGKPRIWGLHNYRDTNRFHKGGTRSLLRVTKGQIWLTETGGIVKFANTLKYSEKRAAKATKFMFKLARMSKRIKRLYIYSWFGAPRGARFDAGLVGPDGLPRPAFYVVKKFLHRR